MEILQKKIQNILRLYKSQEYAIAELTTKELISTHKQNPFLYNLLGLILTAQNKNNEAIKIYEEGIKISPNYAMLYNNLGTIYKSKGNLENAEKFYKKSLKLDNKLSETYNNLGNLYLSKNQIELAIENYENAVKINDKFFVGHYNLGIIYKQTGNIEKSKKHLKKSIEINNNFFTAHRILSQLTKYKKNDQHLSTILKIYNNKKIENKIKSELAFALGKAYEDIKDFKNSFKYYKEGNEIRKKVINFSISAEKNKFKSIKKFFNNKNINQIGKFNNTNRSPIFIVGLPRSGTTLVEQILSSHPDVYGGDELNLLPNLIKKYLQSNISNTLLKNPFVFKNIADSYVGELKKISNSSIKVTDKLPINFMWIGLIKSILPNAKVIHCYRNPKDNCFSIYKNFFVNPKLNFAYDINDIIKYYKLYEDLMNYWRKTLSNFIINIKYEDIIINPKNNIQNLLKSCDLSWDDRCLKFYDNKRLIKTASDTQARKKLYKTSIDSWKYYKKFIEKDFKKIGN